MGWRGRSRRKVVFCVGGGVRVFGKLFLGWGRDKIVIELIIGFWLFVCRIYCVLGIKYFIRYEFI